MNPTQMEADVQVDPEVIGPATTLDAFMDREDIEESPSWEFIDGRMVRKAAPLFKHCALTSFFTRRLQNGVPDGLIAEALPELRCNFDGRSIVPDVVFLIDSEVDYDDSGEHLEVIPRPPDLMIEISTPGHSVRTSDEKLRHALSQGCPLGWFVHPYRQWIAVYRSGIDPLVLGLDGVLEGDPVLPGFRLPVAEVFAWLNRRNKGGHA